MVWWIRASVAIAGAAAVAAIVRLELPLWWLAFACLTCYALYVALDEYFVTGPRARDAILRVLDEHGELSGRVIGEAEPWRVGRFVYVYLEQLENAKLVSSRVDALDRARLYGITSAGRAALWSNAQEGEG